MMIPKPIRAFLASTLLVSYSYCVSSELVITVGDGYAAGMGMYRLEAKYDNRNCYTVNDRGPGAQLAEKYGFHHVNLGCWSRSSYFLRQQLENLQNLYPDQAANQFSGSIVLVQYGLDALVTADGDYFHTVISWCQRLPSCDRRSGLFDFAASVNETANELRTILQTLRTDFSGAIVHVILPPKALFDPYFLLGCPLVPGISNREAGAIDQVVYDLFDAQADVVMDRFGSFYDLSSDWTIPIMVGACRFFADVHGSGWFMGYPNKRGYRVIADDVARLL